MTAFPEPHEAAGPASLQFKLEHEIYHNGDPLGHGQHSVNDGSNGPVIRIATKADAILRPQCNALSLGGESKWLLWLVPEQTAEIVSRVRTCRLREPG